MMELLLCTGNPGKLKEITEMLPGGYRFLLLKDAGLPDELPETGATLEENALQKARFAFARTGLHCVADDTGLEVDALGGAPGVLSARYAGEAKDPVANMSKLMQQMAGMEDRSAGFRTVIALVGPDGERTFEGEVRGTVATSPRGSGGFGYDPIFIPHMSDLTFAELDPKRKNAISHRGMAVWKLVRYLEERYR